MVQISKEIIAVFFFSFLVILMAIFREIEYFLHSTDIFVRCLTARNAFSKQKQHQTLFVKVKIMSSKKNVPKKLKSPKLNPQQKMLCHIIK